MAAPNTLSPTTAKFLASVLKSARRIMRKGEDPNGDLQVKSPLYGT